MSLRPILEKILHLLSKNPNAEYQAKLKSSAGKLESAAEALASKMRGLKEAARQGLSKREAPAGAAK